MTITLGRLTKDQLEWARLLHNDPEVLTMLTDPHEVSEAEQLVWFSKLESSGSSQRLVAFQDGVPIGLVRLDNIDQYNRSVCVGLDIHRDFRGKGLARPIYQKVFKEWFSDRCFNRVWLLVASYNEKARHIYSSLGLKEEGVQREALLKEGKYYDYICMSILRREYEKQTGVVEF